VPVPAAAGWTASFLHGRIRNLQTAEPAQNQTKLPRERRKDGRSAKAKPHKLSVNLRAPNKPRPKAPKTLLKNNDGAVSASFSVGPGWKRRVRCARISPEWVRLCK
jgi:hypothetical protein